MRRLLPSLAASSSSQLGGSAAARRRRSAPAFSRRGRRTLGVATARRAPRRRTRAGLVAARLSRVARAARPASRSRRAARPLAERGRRLRDPVAGARGDQQGRVELRPQHGPELRRRDRLDAVHAVDLAALGHWTRTATASPIRGTRTTRSTPRRATSPRPAAQTDIRAAVFSYNHADWYVSEVLELAHALRQRRR